MSWMEMKSEATGEMWHVAPVSMMKGKRGEEGEVEAEKMVEVEEREEENESLKKAIKTRYS